jgi:hypothetical protein
VAIPDGADGAGGQEKDAMSGSARSEIPGPPRLNDAFDLAEMIDEPAHVAGRTDRRLRHQTCASYSRTRSSSKRRSTMNPNLVKSHTRPERPEPLVRVDKVT